MNRKSLRFFSHCKNIINERIDSILSDDYVLNKKSGDKTFPKKILQVMRYAITGKAKRLRPILTLLTCKVSKGNIRKCLNCAVAIELIHNYSLVHDDLPAMDNDDFRRGRPAVHKAFGEAMAILVGDALLTYAFNLLSRSSPSQIIREISDYCGIKGMIGGQVGDIYWNSYFKNLNQKELIKTIHKQKTAALFALCCKVGTMCAGVNSNIVKKFEKFGWLFGITFQLADDIKDYITINPKKTLSYPSVFGLEESIALLKSNISSMKKQLNSLPLNANIMSDFVDFVFPQKLYENKN